MTNSNLKKQDPTQIGNFEKIDIVSLKKAALVLRSLNNGLRQRILGLIDEKQKITVTEIYKILDIEQSIASQQLAIMRKEGVVNADRQGKFIFYSVNYSRIEEINGLSKKLIPNS